jgi:YidC/Oxa1 family membrane protein insertase
MFNTFIYNPILQSLIFIYEHFSFQDLGVAILLLTLSIRVVLYPLFQKSARDQVAMQKMQPELEKLQKDKNKKPEEQAKAMMELYKIHKVNPFSTIFVMLLQLPIFFALFKLFSSDALFKTFDNPFLFGVINLREHGIDFAILAAALQYLQFKVTAPKATGKQAGMQKMMLYIIPIATFLILLNLPRALGLYWAATAVFSILQQKIASRKKEEK